MPQMKMSVRPKDVPYMVEEWKMRKNNTGYLTVEDSLIRSQ